MDPCKRIPRSTFAPRQLRRLYKIPKSSEEFELAFARFYDDVKHEEIIDSLRGAELEEFANFLDMVLQLDELDQELFRKVLDTLWRTCGKRRILPRSYMLPEELSETVGVKVASGGFGDVWKGVLTEGNTNPRSVCIKAMKITVKDGKEGRSAIEKAFYEEVSVWMRLKHPNVVQCLGAVTNLSQIVMDWMENGEVMDYVRENSGASRAHLVLGVAKGLDYLHSRGVIHGDVRPQNILVNTQGDACLADFGLAIVVDSKSSTGTGRGHNSLWAAPETLNHGRRSREADVFSYGLVTIEIFEGGSPWGLATATEVMRKITFGERPARPGGTKARGLTTELWDCLTKCWHHQPEHRVAIGEILPLLNSIPRTRAEDLIVITSGSELSVGGTTLPARGSASIHHRPSSEFRVSKPHAPLSTGTMNEDSSHHHTRTTVMSEKMASHPNPAPAQRKKSFRSFKRFLKRCLCLSCISDEDMVT